MVQINFASREVNCKLVYYGPGRCGKTTNLQVVHAKAPVNSTGELVSIATETDRTLYFDFLPLDLGTVAGMRTKFQLYTVPGQVYYDATRKLVLQGCDGVVFVADSNPDLLAENIESLDNLAKNLAENGLDINDIPLVLQYNKRDLPNAMAVADLNAKLNRRNWVTVEAVAVNGDGVFQTLKMISQLVIKRLNREHDTADDYKRSGRPVEVPKSAKPTAPPPPPPPPPAARPTSAKPGVAAAARPAPASASARSAPPPPPPPPPPPAKVASADAPAKADQGWKTRTGVMRDRVRERMAEIKNDKGAPKKAAPKPEADVPTVKMPVLDDPSTKKKGCLGRAAIVLLACVGVCGSFLSWW